MKKVFVHLLALALTVIFFSTNIAFAEDEGFQVDKFSIEETLEASPTSLTASKPPTRFPPGPQAPTGFPGGDVPTVPPLSSTGSPPFFPQPGFCITPCSREFICCNGQCKKARACKEQPCNPGEIFQDGKCIPIADDCNGIVCPKSQICCGGGTCTDPEDCCGHEYCPLRGGFSNYCCDNGGGNYQCITDPTTPCNRECRLNLAYCPYTGKCQGETSCCNGECPEGKYCCYGYDPNDHNNYGTCLDENSPCNGECPDGKTACGFDCCKSKEICYDNPSGGHDYCIGETDCHGILCAPGDICCGKECISTDICCNGICVVGKTCQAGRCLKIKK